MPRDEIKNLIEKFVKELNFEALEVLIENPRDKNCGDYATNAAMIIGKQAKKSPLEIANLIAESIKKSDGGKMFSKIETIKPGFINFFISEKYLQGQLKEILKQKEKFGDLKIGKGQKVNVEFISANPTGPLTLGNGRGGFCGDTLANVLEKAGYEVTREYYINDRGEQIIKLGHSVLGDDQAVYKGDYIESLKKRLGRGPSSTGSAEEIGEKAAKIILEKIIKPTIKKMGIKFDVWFSEKNLYNMGEVDEAIKEFTKKGFTYQSEGAVWFKSKDLEDDKDRVLIRSDGIRTYFASDIAYLKNKIKRGFEKIIIFLGADHYGYVARLKAATQVLGFDKEKLSAIVMQLVRLFKNGQEVRMSKRTGDYITLEELVGEVGLDVARFFFLQRSADTHLNFDMDLAKEQSAKNPVYYVQYAHARICSILRKAKINIKNNRRVNFAVAKFTRRLEKKEENELIKQLIRFPEIIEDTAKDFQVQRLPQYAVDLADVFHKFYENCRVISEDKKLTNARLFLISATKIVLKNTLDLMGISAPEHM